MARKRKGLEFRVVAAMDTETCNIDMPDGSHVAYPILYICNDFSNVDIQDYVAGCEGEHVSFFRDVDGCINWFEQLIADADGKYIPVCAFYNMDFDIRTLYDWISHDFDDVEVCAQSGANFYYLDLKRGSKRCMRLWDTYHLEMGGLKAMGLTCGLAKAVGDWDYTLIRTPSTKLTDDELFYALRDVQVIPAYLRYILESNPHLVPSDLGSKVLTKTGLARVMAKKLFHNSTTCPDGKRRNPKLMYSKRCQEEKPRTYKRYCLRKACFQGGFTFTAGIAAFRTWHDVISVDAVSMHHTFCNGRYMPINFRRVTAEDLQHMCGQVMETSLSQVLERYEQPFPYAFHVRIYFKSIRLKEGSMFEHAQIGLCAESKFYKKAPRADEGPDSELKLLAEERARGVMANSCKGAVFAFSKLMSADEVILHMTELELWTFAQVYDFDGYLALYGEATGTFHPMETQATLMSNILFKQKQAMKDVDSHYEAGTPYTRPIDPVIPESIASGLRDGSLSAQFVHGYYTSTVKGLFNSAGYGVHAQDEWKGDYVWQDGVKVDSESCVNQDNFEEMVAKSESKVLYTLGMRIVGGSRMHLVIAMMLASQSGAVILDGDTDSMKIALNGCSVDDVLECLEPLHRATGRAIEVAQQYIRKDWPQFASSFNGVGTFEYEDKIGVCPDYFPAWNKARAYRDARGRVHIVMAGVSRPEGRLNVETWLSDMLDCGVPFDEACNMLFGFGTEIDPCVSNSLEKAVPKPFETVDMDVTDYTGVTSHVSTFACIALYEAARVVNDPCKLTNRQNFDYLVRHCRHVEELPASVTYIDGKPVFRRWLEM